MNLNIQEKGRKKEKKKKDKSSQVTFLIICHNKNNCKKGKLRFLIEKNY